MLIVAYKLVNPLNNVQSSFDIFFAHISQIFKIAEIF